MYSCPTNGKGTEPWLQPRLDAISGGNSYNIVSLSGPIDWIAHYLTEFSQLCELSVINAVSYMEKRLSKDEGQNHELHPDLWLQSQPVLWTMAIVYLSYGRTKGEEGQRKQENSPTSPCVLPLLFSGAGQALLWSPHTLHRWSSALEKSPWGCWGRKVRGAAPQVQKALAQEGVQAHLWGGLSVGPFIRIWAASQTSSWLVHTGSSHAASSPPVRWNAVGPVFLTQNCLRPWRS